MSWRSNPLFLVTEEVGSRKSVHVITEMEIEADYRQAAVDGGLFARIVTMARNELVHEQMTRERFARMTRSEQERQAAEDAPPSYDYDDDGESLRNGSRP